MPKKVLQCGPDEIGVTVQRILHDKAGISNAEARGLIAAGLVRRNRGRVSRPDERLHLGDRIEVDHDPNTRYHAPRRPPKHHGYRVVYEDDELVVVDKEPGVLTVPAPSHRDSSLLERLTDDYRRRGFRDPEVRAVHRIDRYTSGLVAFARTHRAFAELRALFSSGRPERVYLAVSEGKMPSGHGRLQHYLAQHPKSLKVQPVSRVERGRAAACTYRVVERFEHGTLLEVHLVTGRRNQIRVQFAAMGYPLIGDVVYGHPSSLLNRTALHASRLAFDHPSKPIRLEFVSETPPDLRRLLLSLQRGEHPLREETRLARLGSNGREEKRSSPGRLSPRRAPARRYR